MTLVNIIVVDRRSCAHMQRWIFEQYRRSAIFRNNKHTHKFGKVAARVGRVVPVELDDNGALRCGKGQCETDTMVSEQLLEHTETETSKQTHIDRIS